MRCRQRSCCYNVFDDSGDPAVAVVPTLAGVHRTVKTFKLSDYDYRTINFFRYRTINYRTNYFEKLSDHRLSDYWYPTIGLSIIGPGKKLSMPSSDNSLILDGLATEPTRPGGAERNDQDPQ